MRGSTRWLFKETRCRHLVVVTLDMASNREADLEVEGPEAG